MCHDSAIALEKLVLYKVCRIVPCTRVSMNEFMISMVNIQDNALHRSNITISTSFTPNAASQPTLMVKSHWIEGVAGNVAGKFRRRDTETTGIWYIDLAYIGIVCEFIPCFSPFVRGLLCKRNLFGENHGNVKVNW